MELRADDGQEQLQELRVVPQFGTQPADLGQFGDQLIAAQRAPVDGGQWRRGDLWLAANTASTRFPDASSLAAMS
ncbi:hypothetical protein [Streptomyces sp. H27-S2]|uniref:hypothetical protein n=1 Tax=Streptomyces antarcticus TaxID=2996458 RepID=UPI002271B2D9|nr:hypothetical protein [Streptomyces sp. H27-S2]MCY0950332.1 hypothetical protein [Streptomyces sp. H27-S2]